MNKSLVGILTISLLIFQGAYYGSTTAPVVIAGGIIKSKHSDDLGTKYKRKDCPVCKGKGWYMSGDNIKKIECTYCEPDQGSISIGPIKSITPAPIPPRKDCPNGVCPLPKNNKR